MTGVPKSEVLNAHRLPEQAEPAEVGPSATGRQWSLPFALRLGLALVPLLLLPLRALSRVGDPDAFWHIATGGVLSIHREFVIQPDPWSATATLPWILNQWLPELLMSGVEQAFGLPGVAWLTSAWTLAVMYAVWRVCRARSSLMVSTLVTSVTFIAMSGSIAPRPQLFTFAFVALTMHFWLKTAEDLRPRYWLIPFTWFWACCHGLWVMSPLVGLVFICGLWFDRRINWRTAMRFAILPIGSAGLAALTPVGPTLLRSLGSVGAVNRYITEWQPSVVTHPATLGFLCLASVPLVVALRSKQKLSWVHILVLGVALALGMRYGRFLAVAAVMVAPLCASALQQSLGFVREWCGRAETVMVCIVAALALGVTGILAPSVAGTPALGAAGLTPQLDALPRGAVVCNEWILGGWLIWRHPDLKVTVDGRAEIYTAEHIESYGTFISASSGWTNYVTRTGCTAALVSAGSPVAEAFTHQLRWTATTAGGWTFFVPPK